MKILMVEDDRALADLVADVLEERGHNVMVSYTGFEATSLLANQDFNLILTDYDLGHGQPTGLEIVGIAQDIQPEDTVTILWSGLDRSYECKQWNLEPDHLMVKDDIMKLLAVIDAQEA